MPPSLQLYDVCPRANYFELPHCLHFSQSNAVLGALVLYSIISVYFAHIMFVEIMKVSSLASVFSSLGVGILEFNF